MKTQAITLMKEEILTLGRGVSSMVAELARLLSGDSNARFDVVEEQECEINSRCMRIEERCMDLLIEHNDFAPVEVRTLVGSTLIAVKLERLADHAHRVAKLAGWASEDGVVLPPELTEMAQVVQRMIDDTLVCYLTDGVDRISEIVQRDARVNYLHDIVSKKLLSSLGVQDQEEAQRRTQFLFCARYLERMGDCVTSAARRTYFIVTGTRLKAEH
jgi:phosphate transport system protein